MTDTIQDLNRKIEEASRQVKSLSASISGWSDRRDTLLIERNKASFGDIEWLINNPNTPGQHDAMRAWIVARFGAEYMGVQASGYYPKIKQQAFSIQLHDRWQNEDGEDGAEQKVQNIKAFFADCLGYLKPNDDGFVSFTYATGQHSGIFDLAYKPDERTWWTTNTIYSRMVSKVKHGNLDAAIAAAKEIAAGIDD